MTEDNGNGNGGTALDDPVLRELAHIRATLTALLAATRYDTLQTIVGNFDYREAVLKDSPAQASKRLLLPRYGNGTDTATGAAIGTTAVEILEKNEGRLGGRIVNAGANPAILYLATLGDLTAGQLHQRPAIWLASAGGTWDMRLGNVLYGGTICAAATAATTTLTVAEF